MMCIEDEQVGLQSVTLQVLQLPGTIKATIELRNQVYVVMVVIKRQPSSGALNMVSN